MPSFSQNMAPVGLPQPQSMSSFMGKPYSGAYFSFRPPGKDMAAFPAPWSSTESPVVERQSPMSHISGSDRKHIYSKDGRSDEGLPGDVAASVSKQGFTRYTKSPEHCKPQNTASVIVRKGHTGGEGDSSDRAVYLGVSHAVYRRSPCTDLCCGMGLGSPPHLHKKTVYNHSWKHGESDPLPQHRQGPAEAVRVSMFSPQHNLTYSSAMDRAYSPSNVNAYPSFYPSHSAYEPLIYHNTSPISKYGQTVQHPAFYYPQASGDLETASESKDSGSMHKAKIPVFLKHPVQPAGDHYVSLPIRDPMSNVNFLQGFEYPGFMAPRLNVNTSPIHGHRHPHAVHRDFTSHKHVHHPVGYRDISEEHSSKTVCREQTSPAPCARNSTAGGSRAHSLYAFSPPRTSAYMEPRGERLHMVPPAIYAPNHLNVGVESSKRSGYHVLLHTKHPHVSPPHPASSISHSSNVQKILYCPPRGQTLSHTSPTYGHRGPLKRPLSASSPVKTHDDDDVFVVESLHKRRRSEQGNAGVKSTDVSPPLPVINNVFSLAPYRTHLQMSRLHLSTLQSRLVQYSSERRAEQSDEDVKLQFESKDVLRIPAVEENVKDRKPLPGRTEPASFSKDRGVDSPKAMVIKTETFEQTLGVCSNIEPTMSRVAVQVKQERLEDPEHTCAAETKSVSGNPLKVETNPGNSATKQCKHDEEMDQRSCSVVSEFPELLKIIKKEPEEIDLLDIRRLEVKPKLNEDENRRPVGECGQKSLGSDGTPTHGPAPPLPEVRPNFLNIPPQCLKLSTYNIICPNTNLPRSVQKAPKSPEPTQAMPDSSLQMPDPSSQLPDPSFQMPVRKHFFELHQSLVKLISKSVAATSEDTLRAWLSKMQLSHVASGKTQRVRCLLGAEGRAACLNEEMMESLQQVYQRMNEYSQECCPFPFVMRTGDVFLPILVVKEVLFSSVQGSLIDQVLQEHKVELRPTTLSEEKALIAMHKRACSSRLRRLMSYKHFPTVYADVVNLLYYTCVCKQLESAPCEVQSRVQD
uniref:Uncharacterized protein n=1 Tax=Knipowitschia caucasica TaxID=637954 RepID=A0AAV2L7Z5_KNICA